MSYRWIRASGMATIVAISIGIPASVGADPIGTVATLECDGTTYEVIVNSNGQWSPAHDANSNAIFIPTAFGTFTGTIFDEEGNLVDTFTDEGTLEKGRSNSNARGPVLDCTFTETEVSDGSDPEFPEGFTFGGTGEVSGSVAAAPR